MKRIVLLALLAACGSKGKTASPEPVDHTSRPPEVAEDPNAPDAGPDSKGELTMEEVEANMGPVRQAASTCAGATTYTGKVQTRVTIYPDGHATSEGATAAGGGTVPPEIARCIADAFAKASFPASERGQRFQYSFTFK